MRTAVVASLSIFSIGCSSPEEPSHEAIMDRIEKQVHLPQGAASLKAYSRYYADAANGEVVATYMILPKVYSKPGDSCEEILGNLTSRTVSCPAIKLPWSIPAGQRTWLKNEQDLPFMSDGGCAEVNVTYSKTKSAVTSVGCNGLA